MNHMVQNWDMLWRSGIILLGTIALGLIVHYVLFQVIERFSRHTRTVFDSSLVKHCRGPARLVIPLVVVSFVLPHLTMSPTLRDFLSHVVSLCFIGSAAWFIIEITSVLDDLFLSRYDIEAEDNLAARKVHTQLKLLKRIVIVVVGILAMALMLMTFERARHLGASILASAGIAGIIIGLAAQRTLATILAGIQIAITQPIRLDDVVIVENEWGRIEEITLTYVVVRIWDLRRLILPVSYFIEKPFQNWTRQTADILGTVYLYVDYTVPVQAVREELQRILQNGTLWDGRVWGLQVTNTTERTVELRALMSASNASNAWSLRCEVREKLIEFVQNTYPDGLPKLRAEIQDTTSSGVVAPASGTVK